MRVLFVLSRYPTETFAIVEIDALRTHGVDVIPLSMRGGRRWLRQDHATRDSAHEKVRVVPFLSLRTWWALVRFFGRHPRAFVRQFAAAVRENAFQPGHLVRSLFVCLKAPAVADLVRDNGIDAVHVYWGHYLAMIIPFVKCETPNVPASAFLGAYSILYRTPSGPRVLAEANLLTTHFEGHVPEIRDGWLHRDLPIALNYHGVHLAHLKPRNAAPGDGVRIVILSRLVATKNVDEGIEAFALLRRDHPEIALDIVGHGPCRKELERLVQDLGIEAHVTFHGLVPHEKALSIVARAAVMMLPSPIDYYPNAIKEAMALGVPCAAYAIPGVAGYDPSGKALRLAIPGNVDDLARAAGELIEDPELARATVAAAKVRVRDFDVRTTSARQAELFRALVDRKTLPAWVI
jgi:glycosyltransferase involved in cell wall biosynthesis